MKLSKVKFLAMRGQYLLKVCSPSGPFFASWTRPRPPWWPSAASGVVLWPFGSCFSQKTYYFGSKYSIFGQKTVKNAKKRSMTTLIGRVPQGLGLHLCHEEVGWPKTTLKLKIWIFFIKYILEYSKNYIIYPSFALADSYLKVLEHFYQKKKISMKT